MRFIALSSIVELILTLVPSLFSNAPCPGHQPSLRNCATTSGSRSAGKLGKGSVQNLSHISSGDGFGLHELRLIERPHVHVALGGPCGADDVAKSCGRQIEA